MADHALGGRSAGFQRLRLPANGALESSELALGQGDQERLEYDNGLSQAGIQVVVVRVHVSPHFLGIRREPIGKVISSMTEVLAKILNHLLERAYFMEKLEPLGKQDAIEQAAHARGTLALLSLKIGGIEGAALGTVP